MKIDELCDFNRKNYADYSGVDDFQNRCFMNDGGQCVRDPYNRYCGRVRCIQIMQMEIEMQMRIAEK